MFEEDVRTEIEKAISEFQYVVEEKQRPHIAFGTRCERFPKPRKIVIKKYKSAFSFDRAKSSIKPSSMSTQSRASEDTRTAFGSTLSRFQYPFFTKPRVQSNTDFYEIQPKKSFNKPSYPLNSAVPRVWPPKKMPTPAPSDYFCKQRRTELSVSMGFGKQRLIIPEVAVFCGAENTSKCHKCLCKPIGDYFHDFTSNLDICRRCMREEIVRLKSCRFNNFKRACALLILGKYKPARWCDFFHRHHAHMIGEKYSRLKLRRKINLENHVYIYHKMSKWYLKY